MKNKLSIREFIGLHLIHSVEIVAGWPSGQYNVVSSIVTANHQLENLSTSIVLCSVDEITAELFELKPAAIFVSPNISMKPIDRYIGPAMQSNIPLILLKSNVSLIEMRELLQFSLKLKVHFKPREYEKVNFLLGKFDVAADQSICDLLSVYFVADVILLDKDFQQIDECYQDCNLCYKFQVIDCIRSCYQSAQVFEEIELEIEDRYVYALPLICQQSLIGYLIVLGLQTKFRPIDHQVLCQIGHFGLQNLLLQKEIEEVKKSYKDNFLYDLLYNNFKSGYDLVKFFHHLGIDLSQKYQLFVLQPDKIINNEKEAQILQDIERLTIHFLETKNHHVISLILHDQVSVIFNCRNDEYKKTAIKMLAESLKQILNDSIKITTISIGIGRFYAGISDIYKSYEEAKQALILSGFAQEKNKVSHFEDLGIMAILAQLDKEKLSEYNQMMIGKLIHYDKKNETNYLRLLQVYFEHNYNLNMTAETLFMHANTVRNHLKKIEEILDVDLQNFNDCLQIYLACKTYWIVNLK